MYLLTLTIEVEQWLYAILTASIVSTVSGLLIFAAKSRYDKKKDLRKSLMELYSQFIDMRIFDVKHIKSGEEYFNEHVEYFTYTRTVINDYFTLVGKFDLLLDLSVSGRNFIGGWSQMFKHTNDIYEAIVKVDEDTDKDYLMNLIFTLSVNTMSYSQETQVFLSREIKNIIHGKKRKGKDDELKDNILEYWTPKEYEIYDEVSRMKKYDIEYWKNFIYTVCYNIEKKETITTKQFTRNHLYGENYLVFNRILAALLNNKIIVDKEPKVIWNYSVCKNPTDAVNIIFSDINTYLEESNLIEKEDI